MQPDITTTPTLTDKDFRAFEACAIPRDLILAAGLRRVDTHEGAAMVGRQSKNGADFAGILIPYLWPGDPHPREYRLRRDHPDLEMKDGQAREKNKYLSPPGKGNLLYFPPDTPPAHLADTSIPIVITEGEKKTLSLAAFYRNRGAAALIVGLSGVWNWRGTVGKTTTATGRRESIKGPIPDLDRIEWSDRQVLIIFDSNVATNDQVFYARRDLTKELIERGAVVYHVDLPEMEGVNGVDDFLAAAGAAALAKLIDQATAGEPAHRLYYGAEQQDMIPAARRVLEDLATDEADNPTLFWSGGILSRAIPHLDQVKIEPITDDLLSYRLVLLGKWYTGPLREQTDKASRKYRTPPKSLIRHIRATPADATPFPILHRAVTAPVFTAAGDLLTEPGFHRESGIYFLPTFELLPLPARIKPADVNAARALIEGELLIDFPWADPADRENAIALMLLPFVRDMIAGPTPLHMIEASIPGSGKGLLAYSLLTPAMGGSMGIASFTQPETDDEWSKRITGALMTGKGAILIDNLRAVLDSGVLASALTQTVWNDRILGTRHLAEIPIRCAWVATGNNPTLSSEIARRCARIRLEPSTDRPEDRQDFRHAVLSEWIEAHRAELVRACHVLIRNWIDQGRPRGSRPMGSFENYAAVMGGILEASGYTRFLSNAAPFRDRADVERSARGALCNEWWEWAQLEPGRSLGAPAGAIFDQVAKRIDGLPLQGYTDAGLIKSFGRYLAANNGMFPQYYDDDAKRTRRFRIEKAGIRKGMMHWRVELVEEF